MILVIFLIIVLAAGWWIYQDWQGQENALEQLAKSGFDVDYTLEGRPIVAFDDDDKKIAFVSSQQSTIYDYAQVLGWDWGSEAKQGWENKSDPPESYYVVFYLRYEGEPKVKVEELSEHDQEVWRNRLERLLNPAQQ